MRPSGSRSMRTLRDGSELALDFGMEELALPVGDVRKILSCFRAKWVPVCVKKTRQNKRLEPRPDSIRTGRTLGPVATNLHPLHILTTRNFLHPQSCIF